MATAKSIREARATLARIREEREAEELFRAPASLVEELSRQDRAARRRKLELRALDVLSQLGSSHHSEPTEGGE